MNLFLLRIRGRRFHIGIFKIKHVYLLYMVESLEFIICVVQFEYLIYERIWISRHGVNVHGILQFYDLNREIVSFTGFYCHNSPFQVISRTLEKHYSSKHYSSVYYSSFLVSVWHSEKHSEILLFTEHYSLSEKFSSFTCIIHFIVNLVYGYSNSRNRIGLSANSFHYQ